MMTSGMFTLQAFTSMPQELVVPSRKAANTSPADLSILVPARAPATPVPHESPVFRGSGELSGEVRFAGRKPSRTFLRRFTGALIFR